MIVQTIIIVLFMSFCSVLTIWATDREPPIAEVRQYVETPNVNPGGQVRVHYNLVRKRICQVHIEHIIYDHQRGRYPLPDEDWRVAPGQTGIDDFAVIRTVPPTVPQGTTTYRSIRAYYCNPLHRWLDIPIIVHMQDVQFNVIGPAVAPEVDIRQFKNSSQTPLYQPQTWVPNPDPNPIPTPDDDMK